MITYSFSQLYAFNKCRYLWWLSYVKGIRPVKANERMNLGSLIHVGLAEVFKGNTLAGSKTAIRAWATANANAFLVAMDVNLDVYLDQISEDAFKIVQKALEGLNYGKEWRTVVIKGTPAVEMEFAAPLDNGDQFGIRVDWVAKHVPTGQIWLWDHKTRVSLQPITEMDWNAQMAIYQYVLGVNNVKTAGTAVHQIRATVPAVPKLNKDGSMSRADLMTDWRTYSRWLTFNGLNPDDYLDMQQKLSHKVFSTLAKTYRSPELLNDLWHDMILATIDEMRIARERYEAGKSAPRNMGTVNCRLCSSAEFCQLDLARGDTQSLVEMGAYAYRDAYQITNPSDDSEDLK